MISKYLKLFMCSPNNFHVKYVINPWMEGNVSSLNTIEAEKQWNDLLGIIRGYINVEVIEFDAKLPDIVFIANAGLLIGNKCLVSTFRHKERHDESKLWYACFQEYGYTTHILPSDIYFEGEGDALYDPHRKCIWAGYGKRSSQESHSLVSRFFDIEVVPIELIDDHFYHLDTCFSVLSSGDIMYVPELLSQESLEHINKRIPLSKQIHITRKEAIAFTCNAVVINDTIICNNASERVLALLQKKGFSVVTTPLTEFMKAGGSSKCLVLTEYKV